MAGKVRTSQIQDLTFGGEDLTSISGQSTSVKNIGVSSLSWSLESRLLPPPTENYSVKKALVASDRPSSSNPFMTLLAVEEFLGYGESTTWRLPVNSLSSLPEESTEGDCLLVKDEGIYQFGTIWSPILRSLKTSEYNFSIDLRSRSSRSLLHDRDDSGSRAISLYEQVGSPSTYDTVKSLDMGMEIELDSTPVYSEILNGDDDGNDRVLLSPIGGGNIYASYRQALGSRAIDIDGFARTRSLIREVSDGILAWSSFSDHLDRGGYTDSVSSGRIRIYPTRFEMEHDLRLVEAFSFGAPTDPSVAPGLVSDSLRVDYPTNDSAVCLAYKNSADEIWWATINPSNPSSLVPALWVSDIYRYDAIANPKINYVTQALQSVYQTNSTTPIYYDTVPSSSPSVLVDPGAPVDQISIVQGENDEPVMVYLSSGEIRWWCREYTGTWSFGGGDTLGSSIDFFLLSAGKGNEFDLFYRQSGSLKYHRFSWDGTSYTNIYDNGSGDPDPKILTFNIDSPDKIALSFWDNGYDYQRWVYYLDSSGILRYSNFDDPTDLNWSRAFDGRFFASIRVHGDRDLEKSYFLLEDYTHSGVYYHFHDGGGWNYNSDTASLEGKLLPSPLFGVSQESVHGGSIRILGSYISTRRPFVFYINSSGDLKILMPQPEEDTYAKDVIRDLMPSEEDNDYISPPFVFPSARRSPIAYVNGRLWMFGGRGITTTSSPINQDTVPPGDDALDGIWSFYLETKQWTKWDTNFMPLGRYDHGFVTYDEDLYLFGGYTSIDEELVDRFIYLISTSGSVYLSGYMDRPRAEFASVVIGGTVYLAGGVEIRESVRSPVEGLKAFSISSRRSTMETYTCTTSLDIPKRRRMSAAAIPDVYQGTVDRFILYGGYDDSGVSSGVYLVTVDSAERTYSVDYIAPSGGTAAQGSSLFYTERNLQRCLVAIGGQTNVDDDNPSLISDIRLFQLDDDDNPSSWQTVRQSSQEGFLPTAHLGVVTTEESIAYSVGGLDNSPRRYNMSVKRIPIEELLSPSYSYYGNFPRGEELVPIDLGTFYRNEHLLSVELSTSDWSQPDSTYLRFAVAFGDPSNMYTYSNGWSPLSRDRFFDFGLTIQSLSEIGESEYAQMTSSPTRVYLVVGLKSETNQATPSVSSFNYSIREDPIYREVSLDEVSVSFPTGTKTIVTNQSQEPKSIRVSILLSPDS